MYSAKAERLELALADSERERARAETAARLLDASLKMEREAAFERSERLAESAASHEKLEETLAVCDFDPSWRVPDVLYERLCGDP
jgi:hypothetical protein